MPTIPFLKPKPDTQMVPGPFVIDLVYAGAALARLHAHRDGKFLKCDCCNRAMSALDDPTLHAPFCAVGDFYAAADAAGKAAR